MADPEYMRPKLWLSTSAGLGHHASFSDRDPGELVSEFSLAVPTGFRLFELAALLAVGVSWELGKDQYGIFRGKGTTTADASRPPFESDWVCAPGPLDQAHFEIVGQDWHLYPGTRADLWQMLMTYTFVYVAPVPGNDDFGVMICPDPNEIWVNQYDPRVDAIIRRFAERFNLQIVESDFTAWETGVPNSSFARERRE